MVTSRVIGDGVSLTCGVCISAIAVLALEHGLLSSGGEAALALIPLLPFPLGVASGLILRFAVARERVLWRTILASPGLYYGLYLAWCNWSYAELPQRVGVAKVAAVCAVVSWVPTFVGFIVWNARPPNPDDCCVKCGYCLIGNTSGRCP